jgi:hypothetical protein
VSYIGWFIAVVGLVGVIFGILQLLKVKKMSTVPFKKPSEITGPQAADAKGHVSTEGAVHESSQPLRAPMSGKPCLAAEIVIERKWEKWVMTEKGREKKTGTEKAFSQTYGTVFALADQAGRVLVDTTGAIDADMEKSHSHTVPGNVYGGLAFGNFQFNANPNYGDSQTTGWVGTEKIISISPTIYVLGLLQPGGQGMTIGTPKGIGTGKLVISHRGREKLMSSTKLKMILGFVFGVLFMGGGTALGVLGPAPVSTDCDAKDIASGPMAKNGVCSGRLTSSSLENSFKWTVKDAGGYRFTVTHPSGLAFPIFPKVDVVDSTGNQVLSVWANDRDQPVGFENNVPAGTYTITISDRDGGKILQNPSFQGGFSYVAHLEKLKGPATPTPSQSATASPSAAAATASAVAAKPTTPALKPGGPAPKPTAAKKK